MRLKSVNLIPKSALKSSLFKRLKAFNRKNKRLTGPIILALLVIFFLAVAPALAVKIYKRNVAMTKRAMEDTKIKFKKLQSQSFQLEKLKTDLLKEETLMKQHLNLLFSTSSKARYSDLLLSISGLLPQDLWINRFIMNENEIQISGSTLNSQLLAELMNKLDTCKDFRNSRFISSEKQITDSHTIYNFQIVTEPSWQRVIARERSDEAISKERLLRPFGARNDGNSQ